MPNKLNPYVATFKKHYLGSYATPVEAAVAFARAAEASGEAVTNARHSVEDEHSEPPGTLSEMIQQTPMDFTARDDDALHDNGHRRVANGGAATQAAAQDTYAIHDEEFDEEEQQQQQEEEQVGVVVEAQGL